MKDARNISSAQPSNNHQAAQMATAGEFVSVQARLALNRFIYLGDLFSSVHAAKKKVQMFENILGQGSDMLPCLWIMIRETFKNVAAGVLSSSFVKCSICNSRCGYYGVILSHWAAIIICSAIMEQFWKVWFPALWDRGHSDAIICIADTSQCSLEYVSH